VRNPPEYKLYERQQRLRGLEGVPRNAARRCGHKCKGMLQPQRGTQFFDADGHAMVGLTCSICGVQSVHYWTWTRNPPAENPDYGD
jgi:hypothetical protein